MHSIGSDPIRILPPAGRYEFVKCHWCGDPLGLSDEDYLCPWCREEREQAEADLRAEAAGDSLLLEEWD